MPTGEVEKTAEFVGTLSPAAPPTLDSSRDWDPSQTRLGIGLGRLSRQLTTLPSSERDVALASALETLGLGLSADRVRLFLSTSNPDRFEAAADWHRSSGVSAIDGVLESIELGSLPGRGVRLIEGKTLRLGGVNAFPAIDGDLDVRLVPRWSRARSRIYVPCRGPGGLLGFFRIDAGLSGIRWSNSLIDQAALVGCLVADFLERHRLGAEIETAGRRHGHGERLEILGRVAGSVAHDFNNVLTAILGYADLLEMELNEKGPGQAELMEIREAATRAADLVEQVLSFGRCSGSGAEPVDLAGLLTRLEGMLRRVVGEGTLVDLRLAEGIDPIRVDPGQLERVLLNLAANARDAMIGTASRSGRFELSTQLVTLDSDGRDLLAGADSAQPRPSGLAAGRYVRLTARDNGCGIDPADHERIFEPFFTTKGRGTGLGLATAAEVLREAGGAIRIESRPGSGTSFHLYFPV